MSNDDLATLIEELKREIDRLDRGDREARERLGSLVADIERRIDSADDSVQHEDLMEGMREAIERFEVEHPRATGVINNIMVMLGSMGI